MPLAVWVGAVSAIMSLLNSSKLGVCESDLSHQHRRVLGLTAKIG